MPTVSAWAVLGPKEKPLKSFGEWRNSTDTKPTVVSRARRKVRAKDVEMFISAIQDYYSIRLRSLRNVANEVSYCATDRI